jgi:hypothetical protein
MQVSIVSWQSAGVRGGDGKRYRAVGGFQMYVMGIGVVLLWGSY